jgi:hypothetical protein
MINTLIKCNANVRSEDPTTRAYAMNAAKHGHEDVVRILMGCNAAAFLDCMCAHLLVANDSSQYVSMHIAQLSMTTDSKNAMRTKKDAQGSRLIDMLDGVVGGVPKGCEACATLFVEEYTHALEGNTE